MRCPLPSARGETEQTAVDVVRVLGALILELGHARQLTKLRVAGQHRTALCGRGFATERAPSGQCLRPAAGRPAHGCGDAGAGTRRTVRLAQVGHHGTGSRNRTVRGPGCAPRLMWCPKSACRWAECRKECVYVFFCHYDVSPYAAVHHGGQVASSFIYVL